MTTTINYNSATLEVKTDDRSYRYRQLMGEDSVTLIFSLTYYIELPVGAFIDYQGQRYTMLTPQNFKKISNTNYEYTLVLEAAKGAIAKYKFKDTASNRLKFPLTAKPAEFLNMLVANMNMRETGWIAGDCIDAAEKTVNFSFNYCDEALQMIADAFETEWHIDNKTIHLKKIEYNKATPLQLSYGKGNGFKSGIKRDNNSTKNKAIEILYTQGGERNIDPSKYGSKQLLLPINQTYTLNGKQYITDANGYSIRRNDKTLVTKNEGSLDCSDIYPQREGTISSVVAVNTAKNFYDIIDTEIPDALNYTNNIIKGETMTVIFQTGMLAGREFEVKYYHTAIGSKAAKRFEIVPQEIDGQTMPNETFKPAAGNKYKVFHIEMPGAYIRDNATQTGAEWDMLKKAAKYMAENENQDFTFNGQLDPIWSETNWLNIGGKIKIGGFVSFSDASIIAEGVLIRIIGIKDFMTKPYQPELELSNAPVSVSVSSVIGKLETTEVAIETAKTEGVQFTKRSYRSAKETMDALSEAMQNYSGAINPVAIQTMQMLVGDESLQLRFVNSKTAPVEIDPVIQWIQASKTLSINSTIIQHMTLGIDTISNSHAVNEYKFWNMAAYQSPAITDATKKYFIYAKVSKTTQVGTFTMSETAKGIESEAGYYYLLIGLLNSEIASSREISLLYGFSEILPSRIVTNKIQSNDGNTYIDLINGIIGGKISFKAGSNGLANITEWASAAQDIQDAQATANQAILDADNAQQKALDNVSDYNAKFASIQQQVDGEVNNWFYAYTPTSANYPSSAWTTDAERSRHVGDTFTNTQAYNPNGTTPDAGKSWRYINTGGVYSWSLIADSDAVKALLQASEAQAAADGKRTTYLIQPTKYQDGDTWILAADTTVGGIAYKAGDMLTATQSSATYNGAHWVKKVRYTDDTAANAAQNTANAAQSAANTANGKLAEIADDNKLTPGDKQIAKKEWEIIVSEFNRICNYADIYNQSYDDYMDAFDNLNAYLQPLLANMTISSDINGADFREAFKWYYEARQDIYNSVAAATKTYTDGKIANLYIGGENIIVGSKRTLTAGTNNWKYSVLHGHEALTAAATLASIAADTTITAAEKSTVKAEWDQIQYEKTKIDARADSTKTDKTAYATAYANLFNYITPILANMTTSSTVNPTTFNATFASYYAARQSLLVAAGAYLKNGATYVFSVGSISKSTGTATGTTVVLYDFFNNTSANGTVLNLSASRQFYTFTVPAAGYFSLLVYAGIAGGTANNVVTFDQLMLQEGNKATTFSPAVRHVTEAMQGSTEMEGGLVASNLIMMKDLDGNIRAGMSGLNDNIAVWGGGTYADALAWIAKIILAKDGSGQLAGGKINWDAAGAMNVGLFSIFGNILSSGNISFTSDALENIASIGGSTTDIASPGSISAGSYNSWQATLNSAQFTLAKNSIVKFRVTRSITLAAPDYSVCYINIYDSANKLVSYYPVSGNVTASTSASHDRSVNLPAGTYYISVSFKMTGQISGNSQTVSITGYGGTGSNITINPISTLTKIANNGFYSYWGATAYLYLRTDYGFEVRFGNFGIQVTTAGVKKMTDGVNWITL